MDSSAASPHIPPAALALPAAPLKESAQGAWVCCPRRKDPTWGGEGGSRFHLNKALGCSGKLPTQPPQLAAGELHRVPTLPSCGRGPTPETGARETGPSAGNTSDCF